MPITKLNTFEGVPIGKENFEEYTSYLSSLVARSNPFIETTSTDFNDIIPLGTGIDFKSKDSENVGSIFSGSLNNESSEQVYYAFTLPSYQDYDLTNNFQFTLSSTDHTFDIPGISGGGDYVVKIEATPNLSNPLNDFYVKFRLNYGPAGSPDSIAGDDFILDSTRMGTSQTYYALLGNVDASDEVYVESIGSYDVDSGDSIDVDYQVYRVADWDSSKSYLINYKLRDIVFSDGLSGRVNVYFGDLNVLHSSDFIYRDQESSSFEDFFTLVDTVKTSANNDTLGSIIFKPSSSGLQGSLIFVAEESDNSSSNVPVEIELYELDGSNNIITLSGTSNNSFAFITNSSKELYSFSTDLLNSTKYTPGLDKWEIPLSAIEEILFAPGDIGYGFESDLLPPVFSKFSSGNYEDAKTDPDVGGYSKGFILTSVNGVPQINDDGSSGDDFYDSSTLSSSDIVRFKSIRLGAEYPKPIYTQKENHQYANQVIDGFSQVNASTFSVSNSLANSKFDNTLYFPYTDFNLNPALILIYETQSGSDRVQSYYYIPRDTEFLLGSEIRKNHYRVEDASSGKVKFNFDFVVENPLASDKYWIVSAEQLQESTNNQVTDYFSRNGKLYSPTANLNITTKILSFSPSSLVDTDLESELPVVNLIPSTKILSSSGGPIISDAEGEFSSDIIYALSYPARIDADEIVRLQSNKYEPDIFDIYYYSDATSEQFVSQDVPYPTYVKIANNEVSWYNRGIFGLSYDPVSRAIYSKLHVIGNYSTRPDDSATIGELRRRSTLSSLAGTIGPGDTNFVDTLQNNSFVYTDSAPKITTAFANPGSLLVGQSSGPPSVLEAGDLGNVLTVTGINDIGWQDISTEAWTTISVVSESGTNSLNATDQSNLNILGTSDQIILSLDSTGQDYYLEIGISTDVVIYNLEVENSVNLPDTGVIAGTYGSSTSIPQFIVSSDGLVSSASDIEIDTNAWTFISDGTNLITAGTTSTLNIIGNSNNIDIYAQEISGSDIINISLSSDVTVSGSVTSPVINLPHLSYSPSSQNGNMWSTSSDVSIVLNSTIRKFSLNGHTHSANDISTGTLPSERGGTGYGSYTNGQLLIGDSSTGNLSKNSLVGADGVLVDNGSGSITLRTNGTSNNTVNALVKRDSNGDFSARNITASSFIGNSSSSSVLSPGANINGILFTGASNVSVPTANPLSFGTGLSSSGTFNGLNSRTVSVNPAEVVMIAGAQTITGAKTFTTIILPEK